MRPVSYRRPEGARTALLLDQTSKHLSLLIMDYPLQLITVDSSEAQHIADLDYPLEQMLEHFRGAAHTWHGGIENLPVSIQEVLSPHQEPFEQELET